MFGWGVVCFDFWIGMSWFQDKCRCKKSYICKVLLRNTEHCMMTLISQWKNKHKPAATTVHFLLVVYSKSEWKSTFIIITAQHTTECLIPTDWRDIWVSPHNDQFTFFLKGYKYKAIPTKRLSQCGMYCTVLYCTVSSFLFLLWFLVCALYLI